MKCGDIIKSASEVAKPEIEDHLIMETYPYTQDHYLFEIIAKKRSERLEEEILSALTAAGGRADHISTTKYVASKSANGIVKDVFHRNQRMSIEDHMAEDMEVVLEAYGKVCSKRIVDKSPMICMKMLRSVCGLVCEEMQGITDDDIAHVMTDESDFVRKHAEAKDIIAQMDKALKLFRELSTGLVE